jgi:hypothetical protein
VGKQDDRWEAKSFRHVNSEREGGGKKRTISKKKQLVSTITTQRYIDAQVRFNQPKKASLLCPRVARGMEQMCLNPTPKICHHADLILWPFSPDHHVNHLG